MWFKKTTGLVKLEDANKCKQCKFARASNLRKHTTKEHNVGMTRCHLFQLLHAWIDAAEQNQILVNAASILHFYNCTETLLLVDSTFAVKVIVLHWCWGQDVVQPVSVSPACIPDSGYCLIGLVDRPAGGGLALLKAHRRVNTWVLGLCDVTDWMTVDSSISYF